MRRPLRVLTAVVLAACTLTACGRPQSTVRELPTGQLSKGDYVRAFEVSAEGLAQRYGVGKELGSGAPSVQQERRVAGLQRLLRAWADRLQGLQPPPEATRAQARFVAGVRGFAADLEQARAALRRGDTRGAAALLRTGRIVSARTRADLVAGRRAFHALGYDIQNLDKAPVETP
jgi:hypothetical protein